MYAMLTKTPLSDGLKCDREGRVYVTTLSGIQVMDQLGRVNAIIPTPKQKAKSQTFALR